MTRIAGLTLTEAEHAIEDAHPGFHLWHSDEGREYATSTVSDLGGSGTTLDAPSVERIEEVIGEWEHEHGQHEARNVA
jgi:hypothetical protein